MDINEKALLHRAHAGDKRAAGTLYEHYFRDIYSYIYYRVSDVSTAEDLSVEVFVHMIRHLPTVTDQSKPFISWLYAIARRLVSEHASKQKQPGQIIDQALIGGTGSAGLDPHYKNPGAQACFQRALNQLPETQKELIIHRFVEGRSIRDIADLIKKSQRAVRALQFQALISLEEYLEKESYL